LTELIAAFGEATVQAATLAYPVDAETAASPDMVKAVLDEQGDSLYFSRARIPFDREGEGAAYWAHIGIYAFRLTTLRRFTLLPRSGLERVEQLEQLRLLENRIPLRVVKTARGSLGVDRPEDLAKVIQILKSC
ncbi:MAG: 3-deoxy-manno-octulosonate cytidylyltransferase, partial [Desulfovibrionaceae bacterium]|nr:3-deoxy-manno-octulosonate cytidylyltransferase [Desulfovibrionaceae bacterium]